MVKNYILLLCILSSCTGTFDFRHTSTLPIRDDFFSGQVQLQHLTSRQGFKVLLTDSAGKMLDQTVFNYVSYQLDTADVNRDGRTEILIGLIKATEFDPLEKKRLFILRIDHGRLRPLWLGSKVCQELVNFRCLNNGIVQTIEKTSSYKFTIGQYYWQSFGLTLQDYTGNYESIHEALYAFQQNNNSTALSSVAIIQ